MNNLEFVEGAKKLLNTPTHYAKGCFGQKATTQFINQKAKQYPSWYTSERVKTLKSLDNVTLLMDCVGLIKYLLWRTPGGSIVYTSNGVPDIDETTMFNKCTDKSTNFDKITPGEVVWMTGHIGIYVGDGCVVECTNAFTQDVLLSSFVKGKAGTFYRKWTKHGKLPYIKYVDAPSLQVMTEHELVEVHRNYDIINKLSRASVCDIVETRDNFGRLAGGGWIDLTKCRRITK